MSKQKEPSIYINPISETYNFIIKETNGNYSITIPYEQDGFIYFEVPGAIAIDSTYQNINVEIKIYKDDIEENVEEGQYYTEIHSDVNTQIHYTATDASGSSNTKIIKFNYSDPSTIPQIRAKILKNADFIESNGELIHVIAATDIEKENYYNKFIHKKDSIFKISAQQDQKTQTKIPVKTAVNLPGPDANYLKLGDKKTIGTQINSQVLGSYDKYLQMNEINGPYQYAGLVTENFINGYNTITWKVCVLNQEDYNNFQNDKQSDIQQLQPTGLIKVRYK